MKKFSTFSICIAVLAFLAICQAEGVIAKDNYDCDKWKNCRCNLAGTWRVTTGFATFIPLDRTGRKFSVIVDGPLPEHPPFIPILENQGLVPDAISPTRGVAFKVAINLYKFTLSKNILDPAGKLVAEVELSGETKFLNCDLRVLRYTVNFFEFIYDEDGKLVGKDNFLCVPAPVLQTERYKLAEPCAEVLPPFPE